MSNSKIDLQSKKKEFEELFTELDEGNMGNQRRFMDGDKRSQEVWQWIEYLLAEREKEVREEIRKQLHLQSIRTTWIDEMDGELLLKVIGDLPRGKPDNYFIIITKDTLENI